MEKQTIQAGLRDTYIGVRKTMQDVAKKHIDVANAGMLEVCKRFYALVGPVNYCAYSYMTEMIDYVDEIGKLKQNSKKLAKQADKVYKDYQTLCVQELHLSQKLDEGDREALFHNQNIRVSVAVAKHIEILRWSVKSYLDRLPFEGNTYLASGLITVQSLINISLECWDEFFTESEREYCNGESVRRFFIPARFNAMYNYWKQFIDVFFPEDITVNFDNDANCNLAYKIIKSKLKDTTVLNNAAYEALKYDKGYSEQVKMMEAQGYGQK